MHENVAGAFRVYEREIIDRDSNDSQMVSLLDFNIHDTDVFFDLCLDNISRISSPNPLLRTSN